ncbi:MAG: helix-turn-helix transcriptional regulator [Clostridia bacterium]|nr:helix-turn-helix transcriptional regulator [Clostridia bacterium]
MFETKKCKITSKPVLFTKADVFLDPDMNVDCHLYTRPDTCYHKHIGYYEFCVITKGRYWYYLDSKKTKTLIYENCIVYAKDGEGHQFLKHDGEDVSQINISISTAEFKKLLDSFNITVDPADIKPIYLLSSATLSYLARLTDKIFTTQRSEYSAFLIRQWITVAITSMFEYRDAKNNFPQYFCNILQVMQRPSSLEKKLNEIMPLLECSSTALNKYFKEFMQTTPNQYFNKCKIQYAKKLLRYTDYGILDISLQAGFESLSHFCKVFKQQTQKTPFEYRKHYSVSRS